MPHMTSAEYALMILASASPVIFFFLMLAARHQSPIPGTFLLGTLLLTFLVGPILFSGLAAILFLVSLLT